MTTREQLANQYVATGKEHPSKKFDERWSVLRDMKKFTPEEMVATGLFGKSVVVAVKYAERQGFIKVARRKKAA